MRPPFSDGAITPQTVQITLLAALLDEATTLLHQLQARIAQIPSNHGYMYGLQDEAIRLETQADIAPEGIRHIESDLNPLKTGLLLQ